MNQEYPERLQLTYKAEDVPSSEDTKEAVEEPHPFPPDDVAISDFDVATLPLPPPTNLDSGDLLVNISTLFFKFILLDIYTFPL